MKPNKNNTNRTPNEKENVILKSVYRTKEYSFVRDNCGTTLIAF